jgi:hypothetical protein
MVLKEKFNALRQHDVWGDFMGILEQRKTLGHHWVYEINCDGAGNAQQFMDIPVCKGNEQSEGINCWATYTPTDCWGHIRLELSIASKCSLEIHQMD